ncbi:MAG: hypothetical protein D3906_16480 [Candidatus Electrothrix sp. AUS1_2]|nr:hypothetical protein [Candidatus Electrothrix sp. AUS1_2]
MRIVDYTSAFIAILLREEAKQAYERFGKGRHPATLNYGDLFSYALAKSTDLPLLFKGDDCSKTDLRICPPAEKRE